VLAVILPEWRGCLRDSVSCEQYLTHQFVVRSDFKWNTLTGPLPVEWSNLKALVKM
jgi:hypothetical protein